MNIVMTKQSRTTPDVVIEYFSQEMANELTVDETITSLTQLLSAISKALRNEDLGRTRLIITGDIVTSVNTREDRTNKEFTVERGAGVVAAKTMPPNADGIVDILIPAHWILPTNGPTKERDEYIQHIAAHEAIHASLFHIGEEPFDLHHRKEFGYAMQNFLSMASEQVEEHLAEYISSKTTGYRIGQTAEQVKLSIEAWQDTLATKLPAIPEDSPDYFQQGMMVTFEALHILWKSLAYLAAELRNEDGFQPIPSEVADLPEWKELIEPWWSQYLQLLNEIPMTIDVDIQTTDKVVHELALHLQSWADGIGFDFHDSIEGPYFRIKIWDDLRP